MLFPAVVKSSKPAAKVVSMNRQAYDKPVSRLSAKEVMPTVQKSSRVKYPYGEHVQISENVKIKDTISPSGKRYIRGGASQVMSQNVRASIKMNKAEAKANARGLKAANKKK